MGKTVIFAGKEKKDIAEFLGALPLCDRNVVAHGKAENSEADDGENEHIVCVDWNRASALGARTFVLQAENKFNVIDEAIMLFDEEYFAKKFPTLGAVTIPQAADIMLLGYHYLSTEVLSRFQKKFKDTAFSLVFLLKTPKEKTSTLASVYREAFFAFAQYIAASYKDKPFVRIAKLSLDSSNDLYNDEAGLAKWLCGYLDTGVFPKSLNWVKAGTKTRGLRPW